MNRPVALITGAGSGIGRACARAFDASGYDTVLLDLHEDSLSETASALDWTVATSVGDVADPRTSIAAVELARSRFGRVDAAVGNAGISLAGLIEDLKEQDLDRLLAVNVKGLVYLARACREELRSSRGSLTIVASKAGLTPIPGAPAYVATKGAAIQLARALALDWAADGVRVNAVCPGTVDTPMLDAFLSSSPDPSAAKRALLDQIPVGRLGTADECAAVVVFLASPSASFVTGVAVPVDGGFTLQ